MIGSRRWAVWAACVTAGAVSATACGGGGSGTGGGTSSSSSTSSGAGGASSSSSSSASSSSGTGGHGGAAAPFTSHGASSYEAQTSLAADAKGDAVAVWIGFFSDGTSAIGYAVSRDGGVGWTAPAYVKSPGGRLASNPVVAVDGQGRFSLAWIGFRADANNPDEHVYLSRLDAATETFPDPVVASDDGTSTTRDYDKPSIAIDADDNVLLTWADFTGSSMGQSPALTFARSVDGTTFTRTTIVNDATFGNLAYLCVDASAGPSAPLYVVHLAVGATLTVRKSTDQGKGWTPVAVPGAANVVFQNPTCVAHGGDLWIAYGSGMSAPSPGMNAPADAVQVLHSSSAGTNFDAPITVSDGGAGVQYLFPQLARDPSGKLEIAYYQGTDGGAATLTRATSATGAGWATSPLALPGNFTLDRTLASWLGDYLGLSAAGGSTLASYTENTQGKAHVALAKVPSP